jgi:uncharacterized protein YjbJ (UPF0337 family)
MSTPDTGEETAGGLVGKLAGKAKAAAGSLTGNDDLAREGRLQEAGAEADIAARRDAAEARTEAEQARVEEELADAQEERERIQAEIDAERAEERIEQDRFRKEADAVRLEQEAARTEARADAIDPEENR